MEALDSIARRYGVLPSQVIRMKNPMKALSIDRWAHNWGVQKDESLKRAAARRRTLG